MGKPGQAKRYFVRGRVQGVGYRYFVLREAAELRVDGYTRNLDDGRVEVYAIGTAMQLNALEGRLWKGPLWSDVRSVDAREEPIEKIEGFHIKH